jgi:hypothetical protein
MLTIPFIAAIVVAFTYHFGVEWKEVSAELKTSLNGYVDWDNSLYAISMRNKVDHSSISHATPTPS